MREILFRGKQIGNGEWVYGNLVRGCDEQYAYIVEFGSKELCRNYVNVDHETVGQYTGLADKNGTKIFEGDIVDVLYDVNYVGVAAERIGVFEVIFYNGCFMEQRGGTRYHFIPSDKCTVIGNIYDNPELLEGDQLYGLQ